MEIRRIVTGYLDENCYLLIENNTCLVVDPGDDYLKIKEEIGNNKVLGILITHSHVDHIGALRNFLTKRNIKIFKKSNLEDQKKYRVGDFEFQSFLIPGHSKDSVAFYFANSKALFVGDCIFKESIGRTDLPGGDDLEMKQSLKKILEFDDDTILYTGHYDTTTIAREKENNPYLK